MSKDAQFEQDATENMAWGKRCARSAEGSNGGGQTEELVPTEPTALALRLRRLKSTVSALLEKRERLPHSFFWSLFGLEISEVRKQREHERMLRKILYFPE
jgi:hypothetical protein